MSVCSTYANKNSFNVAFMKKSKKKLCLKQIRETLVVFITMHEPNMNLTYFVKIFAKFSVFVEKLAKL